jgi:hypothetical protein
LIEEKWGWLGEKMRYYRRPLRDLTEPLTAAGFVIERISEPTPNEGLKTKDPKGYDLLCRLPAFSLSGRGSPCVTSEWNPLKHLVRIRAERTRLGRRKGGLQRGAVTRDRDNRT